MAKRLKEKGVLISVENQKRPHEKRPEKIKRSKEHVNLFDDQGTFNFSSKEKVMFTHITGRDEVMVIDCVSHDFDQTTFQPSINDARWRDIAAKLLRHARSRDSDFADADENLASQHVTFGIQTSPSELNAQNAAFSLHDNQDNSVEASDAAAFVSLDALGALLYAANWLYAEDDSEEASEASTLTDSLPDLLPYDDEASMNETSDLSEVSVNEVSGSLSTVLSSDDEASVNEASGSLTAIVSSDVEAANGQPPLFFIVYVANSKGASKSPAISERVPLMQAVPIGAQRKFVSQ
jgi:hypothetical protein